MRTTTESSLVSQRGLVYLLGILVLGSAWGLSEVSLGGVLQTTGFPYRAGLLNGVGMALMGIALVLLKRPLSLVGVGLVAVGVKLLVVPILQVSVLCKANSCLGVMATAIALSFIAFPGVRTMSRSVYARMGGGALAAVLASVGFYFVGMRVAPCQYLLSFTPGGFVVTEGLVWAAFSASFLPLGYLAGSRLTTISWRAGKMPVYYATSAVILVLCWGISALTIVAGF